jgi:hypothetical protein
METKRALHVVGTGTIGEPLIGLLLHTQGALAVDEVTFHKHSPRLDDRAKVSDLMRRGAKLAVDSAKLSAFEKLGLQPRYTTQEALEQASVVIDCTADGLGLTHKTIANPIFSFGRDHGYFGRILNQTVVSVPTLIVRDGHEITGFCFTPQDGNSLLSSVAAAGWLLDPDTYDERLHILQPYLFEEI